MGLACRHSFPVRGNISVADAHARFSNPRRGFIYNYIRKTKNHCHLKISCIFAALKFIVFIKSFKSWNLIKY